MRQENYTDVQIYKYTKPKIHKYTNKINKYLNQVKSESIRAAAEYAAREGPRIEQDKARSRKPSVPGQSSSNIEGFIKF